jgi:sirohydrochlorin cobaltochelatase
VTSEFEQALEEFGWRVGEIAILRVTAGFQLRHRDDERRVRGELRLFCADDAVAVARYDDAGNYRPLKTAPNLRHGWCIECGSLDQVRSALDRIYPGRLATLSAWKHDQLATTPLRATLERQSGMYRVAATIADERLNQLVGDFCRSDGGCLRTILWKRDAAGTAPSTLLPAQKFDPRHDQTGRDEIAVPLLCQEACNLLVAAARAVVKGE